MSINSTKEWGKKKKQAGTSVYCFRCSDDMKDAIKRVVIEHPERYLTESEFVREWVGKGLVAMKAHDLKFREEIAGNP